MPLSVRRANPGDSPIVAEFNRRLALETEHKHLDPHTLQKGVRAVLEEEHRGLYFLAELDQRVVGQLLITTEWSDWRNGWFWWIQSVYVEESARRMGVFRTLHDHVAHLARQREDVIGLRLYVERENRRAQTTYASLGMQLTDYYIMERHPL